jgi:signal transduction histidine kinase
MKSNACQSACKENVPVAHLLSYSGDLTIAYLSYLLLHWYIRKTIASQKALEESKLEAERLARVKEIFTANVSLEIRTPLKQLLVSLSR